LPAAAVSEFLNHFLFDIQWRSQVAYAHVEDFVGLLILLILVSFSALYTTAFAPVRVNAGSVNATGLGGFRLGTLPSPYSVQTLIANNAPNMTPTGFLTTTPAVPSSGTSYRNNFGYRIRIYILTASSATFTLTDRFGNTSSSITLAVGQEITLDPGVTITPTYSTLTWQFYGC